MPLGNATIQPPNGGLDSHVLHFEGYNRTGSTVTKGTVLAIDVTKAATESTNLIPGSPDSGLLNLRAPTAQDLVSGFLVVLIDPSCADDKKARWAYRGFVDVKVQKNSGNIAIGDPLVGSTSQYADADPTAGYKFIAKAAEAVTGPSSATLAKCFFEGIYNLGTYAAS